MGGAVEGAVAQTPDDVCASYFNVSFHFYFWPLLRCCARNCLVLAFHKLHDASGPYSDHDRIMPSGKRCPGLQAVVVFLQAGSIPAFDVTVAIETLSPVGFGCEDSPKAPMAPEGPRAWMMITAATKEGLTFDTWSDSEAVECLGTPLGEVVKPPF